MKNIIFILLGLMMLGLALYYFWIPTPDFPDALPDAVLSTEPGDSEALDERRAYFTNFKRDEVIEHYRKSFDNLPILRLNYPPEDAQTLIRDQTRSWYLEELVHPLRESFYINGFIPQRAQDDIWYKGQHYYQKVTVKYVTSSVYLRLFILALVVLSFYLLVRGWYSFFASLRRKEIQI